MLTSNCVKTDSQYSSPTLDLETQAPAPIRSGSFNTIDSTTTAHIEESDSKIAKPRTSTMEAKHAVNANLSSESKRYDEGESTKENIKRWEKQALLHFRNSAWEDIIPVCKKVLRIPGQSATNFDILYEIGYAYMRLEENETAAKYFLAAHRIDSKRVSLRLVMGDLRRKMQTGPWRNSSKRRRAVVEENAVASSSNQDQHHGSGEASSNKETCFSLSTNHQKGGQA